MMTAMGPPDLAVSGGSSKSSPIHRFAMATTMLTSATEERSRNGDRHSYPGVTAGSYRHRILAGTSRREFHAEKPNARC